MASNIPFGGFQIGQRFMVKGGGRAIYEVVGIQKNGTIETKFVSSDTLRDLKTIVGKAEIKPEKLLGIIEKFI